MDAQNSPATNAPVAPDTAGEGGPLEAARRERLLALKRELVGGDLFSAAEVAEILDIHPRTVGEYVRDGKLRAFQFGGGWKISEAALRTFVREQTSGESVRQKDYRCAFCGKPGDQVRRLIAGPKLVFICDACIRQCNDILAKEEAGG